MGQLEAELNEAECALAASEHALRTHGYQGITWAFFKSDAACVARLRKALTTPESQGDSR